MKYRINPPGWGVGQYFVPPMTEIDESKNDLWSSIARGHTVPINITPLDIEAEKALAVQQQRQKRGE